MRQWGQFILLLGFGFTSLSAQPLSASSMAPAWVRGIYVGSSPAPVLLPASAAYAKAEHLARADRKGRVLVGTGQSMAPLYQSGTLMVVHAVGYDDLERGQTVVYRTATRQLVAHVLVAKARDGWRTAGLNNGRPDRGGVRADNLVGVVVAALLPVEEVQVALR